MTAWFSRRTLGRLIGGLVLVPAGGCMGLGLQQAYGDLVIRNNDDESHGVTVTAANDLVQARENNEGVTNRFDRQIEAASVVREQRFFEGGDSDVSVAVDDRVIAGTEVNIWRGEGGDDDRHEERLEVTITPAGSVEVTVVVTHTPSHCGTSGETTCR